MIKKLMQRVRTGVPKSPAEGTAAPEAQSPLNNVKLVVMGFTGAGKSTLINCMYQFLQHGNHSNEFGHTPPQPSQGVNSQYEVQKHVKSTTKDLVDYKFSIATGRTDFIEVEVNDFRGGVFDVAFTPQVQGWDPQQQEEHKKLVALLDQVLLGCDCLIMVVSPWDVANDERMTSINTNFRRYCQQARKHAREWNRPEPMVALVFSKADDYAGGSLNPVTGRVISTRHGKTLSRTKSTTLEALCENIDCNGVQREVLLKSSSIWEDLGPNTSCFNGYFVAAQPENLSWEGWTERGVTELTEDFLSYIKLRLNSRGRRVSLAICGCLLVGLFVGLGFSWKWSKNYQHVQDVIAHSNPGKKDLNVSELLKKESGELKTINQNGIRFDSDFVARRIVLEKVQERYQELIQWVENRSGDDGLLHTQNAPNSGTGPFEHLSLKNERIPNEEHIKLEFQLNEDEKLSRVAEALTDSKRIDKRSRDAWGIYRETVKDLLKLIRQLQDLKKLTQQSNPPGLEASLSNLDTSINELLKRSQDINSEDANLHDQLVHAIQASFQDIVINNTKTRDFFLTNFHQITEKDQEGFLYKHYHPYTLLGLENLRVKSVSAEAEPKYFEYSHNPDYHPEMEIHLKSPDMDYPRYIIHCAHGGVEVIRSRNNHRRFYLDEKVLPLRLIFEKATFKNSTGWLTVAPRYLQDTPVYLPSLVAFARKDLAFTLRLEQTVDDVLHFAWASRTGVEEETLKKRREKVLNYLGKLELPPGQNPLRVPAEDQTLPTQVATISSEALKLARITFRDLLSELYLSAKNEEIVLADKESIVQQISEIRSTNDESLDTESKPVGMSEMEERIQSLEDEIDKVVAILGDAEPHDETNSSDVGEKYLHRLSEMRRSLNEIQNSLNTRQ